jgi:N-acetylglutamate synthase-like GNAT family acetyltransferase
MEARKLTLHDLKEVNQWLVDRKCRQLTAEELPKNGFIVPDVCSLLLYVTDGDIGLLEALVSNKDKLPGVRSEGLAMVIQSAVDKAKEVGVKRLVFMTVNKTVMHYGERFGFKTEEPYNLYLKEL